MLSGVSHARASELEAARRLSAVFHGVTHFVGLLAPDGVLLEANRAALELVGARRDDVVGQLYWNTPWVAHDPRLRERVRRAVPAAAAGTPFQYEVEHIDVAGNLRIFDFSLTPVRAEDGRVIYIIPEGRDVTEERGANRLRQEAEARLDGILQIAADAIITIGETQRIERFNKGAEEIFGYEASAVLGQPLVMLLPEEARDRHPQQVTSFAAADESARYMNRRGRITGRRKNGEIFPAEASISKLESDGRVMFTAVLRDMTEHERAQEALRSLSFTDDLTGLYNRRGFMAIAKQTLRQAHRSSTPSLLLFLDMDDFKSINDDFGHPAGDRALKDVAVLLREVFRESDLVARLGGDEFVVLAVGAGPDSLELQRARLYDQLNKRNAAADTECPVSVSLGAAVFDPRAPVSLERLMNDADTALYAAKRSNDHPKHRAAR
ncbi:MAG: sensor domain-containing diguanylate cyclase [Pseudomonadota bacterium]